MAEMNNFTEAIEGGSPENTPVWFMRQAGRYLPYYREIKGGKTIKDICMDSALTADISYYPVSELGVDAAIIFSDILLPLESMGMNLDYVEKTGPLLSPVKNLESLETFEKKAFDYPLSDSIRKFKAEHSGVPLIGFTGGPITLASYIIAGRSDRDLAVTRRFAYLKPALFAEILDLCADAVIKLSRYQKEAGADVIQIFDSWAGSLSSIQFEMTYRPFLQDIRSELEFPLIYFSTGTSGMIRSIADAGFDFLSVDWRADLLQVAREAGNSTGIQGNLDPFVVENSMPSALQEASVILERMKGRDNYIFNLGHGVLPATDPETLKKIVELVHGNEQ